MKRDELIKWLADNNYPKNTTITCDSCKADECIDAYSRGNINGSCTCLG